MKYENVNNWVFRTCDAGENLGKDKTYHHVAAGKPLFEKGRFNGRIVDLSIQRIPTEERVDFIVPVDPANNYWIVDEEMTKEFRAVAEERVIHEDKYYRPTKWGETATLMIKVIQGQEVPYDYTLDPKTGDRIPAEWDWAAQSHENAKMRKFYVLDEEVAYAPSKLDAANEALKPQAQALAATLTRVENLEKQMAGLLK